MCTTGKAKTWHSDVAMLDCVVNVVTAGVMGQWLSTFATPVEDLGSSPSCSGVTNGCELQCDC